MSEVAAPLDRPNPPFARRSSTPSSSSLHDRTSRPLSEISENSGEERRRLSARQSASNLESPVPGKKSRPNSEVVVIVGVKSRPVSELGPDEAVLPAQGDENASAGGAGSGSAPANGSLTAKRSSLTSATTTAATTAHTTATPPQLTIPINLNDYAAAVTRSTSSASSSPVKSGRPIALSVRTSSLQQGDEEANDVTDTSGEHGAVTAQPEAAGPSSPSAESSGHPLLVAKRASLRPSPLGGATYAEVLSAGPSTPAAEDPPAVETQTRPLPATMASPALSNIESLNSSVDSFHTASSVSNKPLPKAKPSWLRRASGTAAFRKPRTPPPPDTATLPDMLPPRLPPRRDGTSPLGALPEPEMAGSQPRSYASAAAAAGPPSRSRLGEGQGRVAHSSMGPPPLPSRDNMSGGIRNRLAALTAASSSSGTSGGSTQGMPRSGSSATLASTGQSALREVQQRLPSSAQRFMGHAGSAVQKGWMGLRSRGMGGSISSLSALGVSPEASGSRPSAMARKASGGRPETYFAPQAAAERGDGPYFDHGVVLREGTALPGQVFGRSISEAGRAWPVVGAGSGLEEDGGSAWEARRRACLPAVMVRAVDYLEIWGPKEEGIFRISGRSSHIARLRKEFDAGADLDLTGIHPGDLDPHAVSGLFKSYIRELPAPLLTHELSTTFEAAARSRGHRRAQSASSFASSGSTPEDVADLLLRLPLANWFALADIVKLLELIPQHSATNRMTLDALKLSFGPSFNIPGVVLTELLERRSELFSKPPPPTPAETARDLINFGEIDLTPPTIPAAAFDSTPESASRSVTPASSIAAPDSIIPVQDRPKKPVRLGSKQSLTRLFNGGGGSSSRSRQGSIDTARSSVVDLTPPRVDLPAPGDRMPSFESEFEILGGATTEQQQEKEERLRDSRLLSGNKRLEEAHYAPGTVQDRARAFSSTSPSPKPTPPPPHTTSTPIADMFAGTGIQMPPLRQTTPQSSMIGGTLSVPLDAGSFNGRPRGGSTDWTALSGGGNINSAPPAHPIAKIRRGTSSFFQSGGGTERHGRSQSVNLSMMGSASAPVTLGAAKQRLNGGPDSHVT